MAISIKLILIELAVLICRISDMTGVNEINTMIPLDEAQTIS